MPKAVVYIENAKKVYSMAALFSLFLKRLYSSHLPPHGENIILGGMEKIFYFCEHGKLGIWRRLTMDQAVLGCH